MQALRCVIDDIPPTHNNAPIDLSFTPLLQIILYGISDTLKRDLNANLLSHQKRTVQLGKYRSNTIEHTTIEYHQPNGQRFSNESRWAEDQDGHVLSIYLKNASDLDTLCETISTYATYETYRGNNFFDGQEGDLLLIEKMELNNLLHQEATGRAQPKFRL